MNNTDNLDIPDNKLCYSDVELLVWATKAAEFKGEIIVTPFGVKIFEPNGVDWHLWNPLTDYKDAFLLAGKLRLDVLFNCYQAVCIEGTDVEEYVSSDIENDSNLDSVMLAACRAIVKAAAEIGRKMK